MKLILAFLLAVVLFWLDPKAQAQAVIVGRVRLSEEPVAPVANRRYQVVGQGGALAMSPPQAVVYLDGVFPAPATPAVVQMSQKELVFVPALLPVQVGTKVEFPNLDPAYHNVFSYSPAKRFDLGRYLPRERPIPAQTFDKVGLVTLRCDIHEHMRALVLVLPTPYFVVTGEGGRFRLEGLPAGPCLLKVWMNSRTTIEHPLVLQDHATLNLDIP